MNTKEKNNIQANKRMSLVQLFSNRSEQRDNHSVTVSKNAFSSGQIESKLWLCRELEKQLYNNEAQIIWVLGGWTGLLSFLLLSRENLKIKAIRSFDQDPRCEGIADIINENWVWKQWTFKAKTINCNRLQYRDTSFSDSEKPSLIINTSTEHFHSKEWFSNIPSGTMLALQNCNMTYEDHIMCVHSEEEFKEQFPLTDLYYSGTLDFRYPKSFFSRYMLIGRK